jgi:glutamine---fructose-6-phosphate transaminase (isomerizing)
MAEGHVFLSETDTEVLVHVIAKGVALTGDVLQGISWALSQVDGAYAFALLSREHPGKIWASRKASPLLMGIGTGENFLASDIPAFLPYTREVVFLDNGELVEIDAASWHVFDARDPGAQGQGSEAHLLGRAGRAEGRVQAFHAQGDLRAAQGHPRLSGRTHPEGPRGSARAGRIGRPQRLTIVACGTSFHAGLVGQVLSSPGPEFRCRSRSPRSFATATACSCRTDLVLTISQSGETADTLAAIRIAREAGVPILGLCNVVGSSIARESDRVVYTQAGPEISVASTKAMCSQMVLLLLMTLSWGSAKVPAAETLERCLADLPLLPDQLEGELPAIREKAKALSQEYADAAASSFLAAARISPGPGRAP